MAASDDGESVDAFLERIASLKIKRDREDEERTRKLEEEILQGRREGQAPQSRDKAMLQHIHDPALSPGNNGHRQETQTHPGLAHFLGSLPNLRRPSNRSSQSLKRQKNFPEKK